MKFLKKLIGGVAMIAAPFLAAPLAAAVGISGTIGTALVGAGVGALGSTLAGGDPLTGALLGGLGAGVGAMSAAPAIGTTAAGAAAPTAAGLAAPAATTAATTGAATGGLSLSGIAGQMFSNPAALSRLAMTVFGRPPQELTAIEQERLKEIEQMAASDRELFEQKLSQSQQMLQSADQQAPNPEQAYGQARLGLERRLSGMNRGLSSGEAAANERRTALAGAKAGATAAAAEEASGTQRQMQLRQAGLSALPTRTPEGATGLSMGIYDDLNKRRQSYTQDLAQSFGTMFGDRDDLASGQQRAGLSTSIG